jgi:hypothetical protein
MMRITMKSVIGMGGIVVKMKLLIGIVMNVYVI